MNISISPASSSPPVAPGLDSDTKPDLGLVPPVAARRGVLDGAFAVLDALAHADEGLGLTALARVSGLAKTSAHRLAEQLVTLGAVQCVEHRYYVGPRMLRIGQRWQPDPLLRRSAQAPVHALAVQSRAMASLRILHEQRLRYICAAVPHGHAYMPDPADPESIARTATGRVLYATQPAGDVTLPDCWTRREWRNLARVHPRSARDSGRPSGRGCRHVLRICARVVAEWGLRWRGHRHGPRKRSTRRPTRPGVVHRVPHRRRPSATKAEVTRWCS